MRVLYVNHTAEVSGAERSLLEPARGAARRRVRSLVATPRGRSQRRCGVWRLPTTSIPGTAGSLRAAPTAHAARARRDGGGGRVRAPGGTAPPRRSGSRELDPGRYRPRARASRLRHRSFTSATACPPGALTTATMRLIAATATTVVANSEYTARSVRRGGAGRSCRGGPQPGRP